MNKKITSISYSRNINDIKGYNISIDNIVEITHITIDIEFYEKTNGIIGHLQLDISNEDFDFPEILYGILGEDIEIPDELKPLEGSRIGLDRWSND